MAISNRADVVVAEGEPVHGWEDLADVLGDAEAVDVVPDSDRRFIVLAPTKHAGAEHAAVYGIDPVAIVTPRSVHGARGLIADEIIEADGLTDDERAVLMAEVVPALATTGDEA